MDLRHKRPCSGYSLIEAAIVLVVIGILLGASLVPISARLRAEKIEETNRRLDDIEQALLGYAYNHRNNGGIAILESSQNIHSPIPSGRPYLPCPDVSGDGIEDRLEIRQVPAFTGGYQGTYTEGILSEEELGPGRRLVDSTAISIDIDFSRPFSDYAGGTPAALLAYLPTFAPPQYTVSDRRGLNELFQLGACFSDKGTIPWSTLGTYGEDPWGNRFTYRVDPIFSSQVLGIGPETQSDMFDPRFPLIPMDLELSATGEPSRTVEYATYFRRGGEMPGDNTITRINNVTINGGNVILRVDHLPGIVCNRLVNGSGCALTNTPSAVDVSGRILNDFAATQMTLFDVIEGVTVAKVFEENEIINGMAYTIVSHGRNGFGAISHRGAPSLFNNGLSCNEVVGAMGTGYLAAYPETENFDFHRNICEIGSGSWVPSNNNSYPHNSQFVVMPIHSTADSEFDDLVRFKSGETLKNTLKSLGVKMDQAFVPPGECDACY